MVNPLRRASTGRLVMETVLGDVLFADDTTVIAEAEEAPEAERVSLQCAQDWCEKCNSDQAERLVLVPGGAPGDGSSECPRGRSPSPRGRLVAGRWFATRGHTDACF